MTPRFLAESEKRMLWEPRVIESGRETVEGLKEDENGKRRASVLSWLSLSWFSVIHVRMSSCHVLKSINFFSVSTEDFAHVISTVFCIIHTNHECVVFGVWWLYVDYLKLPSPWSPPTFNQIWSSGMALLCQVSKSWASNVSSVSVMNLARSVTYTHGVEFSSFPLTTVSQLK